MGEIGTPSGNSESGSSRCPLRRLHALPLIALVTSLALVGIVLAACGAEGTPKSTPSSTPRLAGTSGPTSLPTAIPTPTATSLPTATPVAEPSTYDLLYSQFGETSDTLWRVAPASFSDSEQIAVIDHAPGFGIEPSLSPDGSAIAYTVMLKGANAPDLEAQAFLLRFGREPVLIAQGIDLRGRPLWSPDGEFVVLRRNTNSEIILIRVNLASGEESVAVAVPVWS